MELITTAVFFGGMCLFASLWLYVRTHSFRRSEIQEFLRDWFHPNGEYVEAESLVFLFRPTREDELYHCCHTEHNDVQSGPIYCAKIADWVAFREDGSYYASCEDDHGRIRSRIKVHRGS